MLKFYFKSAARSIARKRLFSLLNMAGLGLGICIFFLSLEFYSYEHGFNRFHPLLSHLFRVGISGPDGKIANTFPTMGPLMENNIPGVRKAIRLADDFNDGAIVAYQPPGAGAALRSFRENGCMFVDAAFLDAFHFPLVDGHNDLDQTNTVVITAAVATELFGADNPVGKTIRLHNQFGDLAVKVAGVTADVPSQSDITFRYLFSIHILENPAYTEGSDWAKLSSWGNDSYSTYVWLDDRADPRAVAATATSLWQRADPGYKQKNGAIFLQPVADMHLGRGLKDDSPTFASGALTWTVLTLGLLILCTAWINYINFATADALSRAKEIGVHKIIGSRTRQIAFRYIAESVLLNGLGLLFARALTQLVQGLFNYITDRPLSFHYIDNPQNWGFVALIMLGGCLLCGGYTGLMLSRLKPVAALHFNDPGALGHSFLRKGLVVFQLAVSCIFIALTLVAYKQINFMKRQDLGMDINDIVVIKGPALRDSTFRTKTQLFRNELSALPFVRKFSSSGSVPGVGSGHNFTAEGITGIVSHKGDDHIEYSISEIDDNFFGTYAIPLVAGTSFTKADVALGFSGTRLIVNETAARILGYSPSSATGKTINWDKTYTILGVVHDYHHRSLKEKIEPIIYIAARNNNMYTVKTDLAGLSKKMATIGAIYQRLYPGNTFTYMPLQETFDHLYAEDQRLATIALSLSGLVIVIAGLGLAGLAAFTVRRRTKEMGIRKVLGASAASLFMHLSKEYLWLVGIAFIIATPVAWFGANRWLREFPFRIQPGWQLFLLSGILCLSVTWLTISYHALRTSFVNPVRQLRTE